MAGEPVGVGVRLGPPLGVGDGFGVSVGVGVRLGDVEGDDVAVGDCVPGEGVDVAVPGGVGNTVGEDCGVLVTGGVDVAVEVGVGDGVLVEGGVAVTGGVGEGEAVWPGELVEDVVGEPVGVGLAVGVGVSVGGVGGVGSPEGGKLSVRLPKAPEPKTADHAVAPPRSVRATMVTRIEFSPPQREIEPTIEYVHLADANWPGTAGPSSERA